MRQLTVAAVVFTVFAIAVIITACPVPENNIPQEPLTGLRIIRNQNEAVSDSTVNPSIRGGFQIIEGRSVVLTAQLFPQGVQGGIHWQSSGRGIVEMSSMSGNEITITGANGGSTSIKVMARNSRNEVYAEAECNIIVIPSSFFKWDFQQDGWIDLPALSNAMVGSINEKIVRSGETPILADIINGGLVLEAPGALIIGSGMSTPTNSPFSAAGPLFDIGGTMDFLDGPSFTYLEWTVRLDENGNQLRSDPTPLFPDGQLLFDQEIIREPYPLWNGRVRISVDYETDNPGISPLRIQVNNNTHERDNASAITNWLVTELSASSDAAQNSGTLSGIFDSRESALARGVTGTSVERVLGNSFISLVLPQGRVLIRSIRIESAD